MRQTPPTPLFPWDAGWLYLLAGLVIVAAATIVPAQRDVAKVDAQLRELHAKEQYCCDRLAAYSGFLDQWQQLPDDMLIRLASAQLNQRPQGDHPVVLASNVSSAVTDWIDRRVTWEPPIAIEQPRSMLSRLSNGRGQLWMLAAGALAVFVGLVLGPTAMGASVLEDDTSDEPDTAPVEEFQTQPDDVVIAYDTDMLNEAIPGGDVRVGQPGIAGRVTENDDSLFDEDDVDAPMLFDVAPVVGDEPDQIETSESDIEDIVELEDTEDVDADVATDDDDEEIEEGAVALRDASDEDELEDEDDDEWEEDEDGEDDDEWDDDEDEEWDDEEYEDDDDGEEDDGEYEEDDEEPADDDVDDEELDDDDEEDEEWEDDDEGEEPSDDEDDEDDDDLFAEDAEDAEDDDGEWEEEDEEDSD